MRYRLLSSLTYSADPCSALAPQGEERWEVLVVAPDDGTIRVYVLGGTMDDRSGLLRSVNVTESSSKVAIQLESGGDPYGLGSTGSAVGMSYVTQVVLNQPLGGRTLSGPNNRGIVEHL